MHTVTLRLAEITISEELSEIAKAIAKRNLPPGFAVHGVFLSEDGENLVSILRLKRLGQTTVGQRFRDVLIGSGEITFDREPELTTLVNRLATIH